MQAAEEENWKSVSGWLEDRSILAEVKKKSINTQKKVQLLTLHNV